MSTDTRRQARRNARQEVIDNAEDDVIILIEDFAASTASDSVKEKTLDKVRQLLENVEPGVTAGKSFDEIVADLFGEENSAPGALSAPNADRANEVAQVARQKLGEVDGPESARRAETAKRSLDGSLEHHPSGELKVVVEARQAIADAQRIVNDADQRIQRAEQDRDTAVNERNAAQAVVADAKTHSHKAAVGKGLVIELDKVQSATKAALGA